MLCWPVSGSFDKKLTMRPVLIFSFSFDSAILDQQFAIAGQFCVKVLLKIFPRGQWSGIGIILELYMNKKCNWGVVIDHWSIIILPTTHNSKSMSCHHQILTVPIPYMIPIHDSRNIGCVWS